MFEKYFEDDIKMNKIRNYTSTITMNVNTSEILEMAIKIKKVN
jgi:hypothetical protein